MTICDTELVRYGMSVCGCIFALTSSQDGEKQSDSDGDDSSSSSGSDSDTSQGSNDSILSGFGAVQSKEKSSKKPQAKSKGKPKVSIGAASSVSKVSASSAAKRNGGKESQATPKKKAKPEVNVKELIDVLKLVSAQGIINPSNGTRDRDIQSKLTKARAALDSIDSDELHSGTEASSLKTEIARVSFLKSLFIQLASEDTVVRVLDNDLVEQMTACSKEDVSTVVCQLQIIYHRTKILRSS